MSFNAPSNYEDFRQSTLKYFGSLPVSDFTLAECIFCGKAPYYTIFTLEALWIVRCECGFVFNRRQPKEFTLTRFYTKSDPMKKWAEIKESKHEMTRQKEKYGHVVKYLKEKGAKSVLDLGCGNGAFLKLYRFEDPFVELTGVDPNKAALEHAKGHEIMTNHATIDNFVLSNRKTYDAVTLFGVLEHIHTPFYNIARVREKIKRYGHLVICVPNVNSRAVRSLWEECFTFCPQHLWYFDQKTIKQFFKKSGFVLKELYTIEPEELPVMKKRWGFKPYDLVPQWAEHKYFIEEYRQQVAEEILKHNEGYKIVAIGQKLV
jgi:2-polyprenyl-3-methyl-5-hydroxy-6-metoxy-1,4-benzoquinol methylase